MIALLTKLMQDIANLRQDQYHDPAEPVADGETVVGQLTKEQQALFSLRHHAFKELCCLHQEMVTTLRTKGGAAIFAFVMAPANMVDILGEDFVQKFQAAHDYYKLLDQLLAATIRRDFPATNFHPFVIRADSQVAIVKDSELSLLPLLGITKVTVFSVGGPATTPGGCGGCGCGGCGGHHRPH